MDIKKIVKAFFVIVASDKISIEPYGSGHINDTYLLMLGARKYILQRINTDIFTEPQKLMENIEKVTAYLRQKSALAVLSIVRTLDDKLMFIDEQGGHWRIFDFVENSFSYESVTCADDLERAGQAFGSFLSVLAEFPAQELYESIPGFHDTAARYEKLDQAYDEDAFGRACEISKEMAFCRERAHETGIIAAMLLDGRLPLRVTHNDTKLNNILFDLGTKEAVCVIDLDTIMPGSVLYDFGDAIRFGASTAAEDETELDKVKLNVAYYAAFARGFLSGQKNLTNKELLMLPFGAKMMCLECGMRFLTDYLKNDVYFKTTREKQNLDRCRTQFKLVREIEENYDALQRIL